VGLCGTNLAAAVGMTYQQIQKHEGGKNRISASLLLAFAEILGVPVEVFCSDWRGP